MATRLKTQPFHLSVGHGETHPHQQSGRLISIKQRRVPWGAGAGQRKDAYVGAKGLDLGACWGLTRAEGSWNMDRRPIGCLRSIPAAG